VREGYEAKVALEALTRAGLNPQLKGVVHEILYRDLLNVQPTNLLTGTRAALTRSMTSVRDDLVLKQAGRVVGRFQLKDTAGSIRETVRQAASGQYRGTVLAGTRETAEAYAREAARQAARRVNVTQSIRSTGISSTQTASIAGKAVGHLPGRAVLAASAHSAGLVGVGIGAAVELASSARAFREGRISGGELAGRVAAEGVKGGISAATGAVVSTAATAGTAAVLASAAISAPVIVPLAVGVGAAVAVGGAVKGLLDRILR